MSYFLCFFFAVFAYCYFFHFNTLFDLLSDMIFLVRQSHKVYKVEDAIFKLTLKPRLDNLLDNQFVRSSLEVNHFCIVSNLIEVILTNARSREFKYTKLDFMISTETVLNLEFYFARKIN